jgi:hypothetical protein
MNVTSLFRRLTIHKIGDLGQTRHPPTLYMGAGLVPLSLKMPATPHLDYLDGTIYSAFSEDLPMLTIEACQIFLIMG